MEISQRQFGFINDELVNEFTLINDNGMEISCLNYGCIITKIIVPDKDENFENVVLGFDSLSDYEEHSPFFGAVCGRVAGRIAKGEFELNGESFSLAKNSGNNHLHGGIHGFDKIVWDAEIIDNQGENVSVFFSRISPKGEEGYPGNLVMSIEYMLTNENELIIKYKGETDKDTLVNVTNHSYFNLSGNLKRDILEHELQLKSDQFLELGEDLIPTGKYLRVEDTPFDFQKGRKIREGTFSQNSQNILVGNGFDHPFLLKEHFQKEIILKDNESGRVLTVETDEPCVVVYSGNMLSDDFQINGVQSKKHLGICLETQAPPDAINHKHFPTIILKAGENYNRTTKYTFYTVGLTL